MADQQQVNPVELTERPKDGAAEDEKKGPSKSELKKAAKEKEKVSWKHLGFDV